MKKPLFVLCPLLAMYAFGLDVSAQAEPAAPVANAAVADPKVKAILERLRSIMHDVQSLTYDGEARNRMPDGKRAGVTKAKVTAEKAESGWKYFVEGTFDFENIDGKAAAPKKGASPTTIRAAYDGAFVLGLQEREKNVRRFATTDPAAIRAEFNQSDAAAPIMWELFNPTPMGSIDGAAKVEVEPQAQVGDVSCDVLWVVPAQGPTPVVPFRAYLNSKNSLPLKMEYYKPAAARLPADKRGEPGMVLMLTDMKPSAEPSGVSFEFETPKGYAVSGSRDAKKPADTTSPAPPKPYSTPTPTPAPAPVAGGFKYPLAPSNDDTLRVGNVAPAFKLKDFEGKEHTLEEFKGKVVLLDFWGSWCPPCRMAMPAVQAVHEKYGDKGVVVLGMNFEQSPKADPEKFKKEKGYTYMSLAKAETVAGTYKIGGWPTFYVIGRDGKIVWSGVGLDSPPGGTTAKNQAEVVAYLQSNLSQAVEKALAQP